LSAILSKFSPPTVLSLIYHFWENGACKLTFSVQATKPLGISIWSLPELKIPVLEFLKKEALWTTSYLDSQIRVGRGATGNLFVFRRE
jgi:hypothetical protein